MGHKIFLLILSIILIAPFCEQALVVSSTERAQVIQHEKEGKRENPTFPEIYQMRIRSGIKNRYTNTTVTSRVRNFANEAQEAVFSIVLPATAFISGFVMEVDGKNYTAHVKAKEEAKRVYEEAVSSGLGAAHVAASARDSNRFTVSVNVEPEAKAAFYLFYEELLQRQDGHYEQVINIHPGQPVNDLSVEVAISESRKIVDLKAPPLRSGNEIEKENDELDPRADLEIVNDKMAIVKFVPNIERQKQLAHIFGTNEENGLSGQFVVQYDVGRDPQGGEVLIQDGYFVHFFAPTDLKSLPKQVVFVLDTSGSMWGSNIQQVKTAMANILDQLNEHDSFSLVEFNSNTKVWNLENPEQSVWYPDSNNYYQQKVKYVTLENVKFPKAYSVNADNIKKAKDAVSNLTADGTTSMYSALEVALHLVELERIQLQTNEINYRQPMIIFLTDGEPTDSSPEYITKKITELNSGSRKAPIFSLSFGEEADRKFLKTISLRNSAFSKHIYAATDASLQLQDFYRHISSPLLSDVKFKYAPTVTSLTRTDFPIHFEGSEIVVCGIYDDDIPLPVVDGYGINGEIISLKPSVSTAISNIERLWAYLSVTQLLEEKDASDDKKGELKQKALDLAIKYSFVTPISSLVVVKPNVTSAVDTQEARQSPDGDFDRVYGGLTTALPYDAAYDFEEDTDEESMSFASEVASPISAKIGVVIQTLSWLNEISNNGFVNVANATYKLGANETFSDNVFCSKTPLQKEGHCSLLHECPDVHAMLKTSDDFFNYFCVIRNEYAGICCPDSD